MKQKLANFGLDFLPPATPEERLLRHRRTAPDTVDGLLAEIARQQEAFDAAIIGKQPSVDVADRLRFLRDELCERSKERFPAWRDCLEHFAARLEARPNTPPLWGQRGDFVTTWRLPADLGGLSCRVRIQTDNRAHYRDSENLH